MVTKTREERELFYQYRKWLSTDEIPPHIVENFKADVSRIEKIKAIKK